MPTPSNHPETCDLSRFRFDLATQQDDTALCRLASSTPMNGRFAVSLRREPSFLDATRVEGDFRQVLVCHDQQTREIVAAGCRSIRDRYINGRLQPVGYLSNLRIREGFRSGTLLARGYRQLKSLHADGRTSLYLTTVAENNHEALEVLTGNRPGLPRYHPAGNLVTTVIPTLAKTKTRAEVDSIQPAGEAEMDELVTFLRTHGPCRQFFPEIERNDLCEPGSRFHSLRPEDILVARSHGEIVATMACWDQRSFRQIVVERFPPLLRWTRPLINAWARLSGNVPLPKTGTPLNCALAALLVVRDNREDVLQAVISKARRQLLLRNIDFLLVGLHERDPLLETARKIATHEYCTHLFLACWADGEALVNSLDDRPVYLELGCL